MAQIKPYVVKQRGAQQQVWATLLDEGRYLASERTMYRLLAANDEVRERRAQRSHPAYQRPELLAEQPNEVWSWDITKLLGPATVDLLLPVRDPRRLQPLRRRLDRLSNARTADVAKDLIAQAVQQQHVTAGQLTVHADRGSSMTSKPVAFLLADLGVTKTHNRPYTSTDNPYSEAQFKTLKYRPAFPKRFDSLEHARAHCRDFFDYYNHHHRHSGIGLMTPATVHHGQADQVHADRARVLDAAYARNPERFVRKAPSPPPVPRAAWINKPDTEDTAH